MSEQPGSIRYPVKGSTPQRANDRRQSPGARRVGKPNALPFGYVDDVIVTYTGGSDTIPRGTLALLWQGDQASTDAMAIAALDLTASRYVIFTIPGSFKLYATPQESWGAASGAASVIGLEYNHWDGWQRWQMVPPQSACFSSFGTTIQLVAGASNPAAGGSDTTSGSANGGLGTSRLMAPNAIAYNPVDHAIYFMDLSTVFVRKLDPATLVVSTTAINSTSPFSDRRLGGFAIDKHGEFYFFAQDTGDNDNPFITRVSADGLTETVIWRNVFLGADDISGVTDMAISPDGAYIYFGGAVTGYGSGSNTIPYQMIRAETHPAISPQPGIVFAGNTGTAVTGGTGILAPNGQGESVMAPSGRVDGAFNYYCAPDGSVYSGSDDTRMIRKTLPNGSSINSVTNHVLCNNFGIPPSGTNQGGDGAQAFTLNDNSGQFTTLSGIAVDSCGNVLIGDSQGPFVAGSYIRYIAADGILRTGAGKHDTNTSLWPTSMPLPALGRVIPNLQRICFSTNDGAIYLTSAFFDGGSHSVNAIYKVIGG